MLLANEKLMECTSLQGREGGSLASLDGKLMCGLVNRKLVSCHVMPEE